MGDKSRKCYQSYILALKAAIPQLADTGTGEHKKIAGLALTARSGLTIESNTCAGKLLVSQGFDYDLVIVALPRVGGHGAALHDRLWPENSNY